MNTAIVDFFNRFKNAKTGAEAWVLPILGVAVFSLVLERLSRGYFSAVVYDTFLATSDSASEVYLFAPLVIAAVQGILTGIMLVLLAPKEEKNRIRTTQLIAVAVGVYQLLAWIITLITLLPIQTSGVGFSEGGFVMYRGFGETFFLLAPALTSALAICVAPFLAKEKS